jgi:haloalkane dehalogenase
MREPQLKWCREHLQNLTVQSVGNGFHHLAEEQPQAVGEAIFDWVQKLDVL